MIVWLQIEQEDKQMEGRRRACEQGPRGKNKACVCHRENKKRLSEAQALSLTW